MDGNNQNLIPHDDNAELRNNNDDIYKDLDSRVKKRNVIPIAAIAAVLIIAAVFVITFADFKFTEPVRTYFSKLTVKITDYFDKSGADGNRIKGILEENGLEKQANVMPFENASGSVYGVTESGVITARANYISQMNKKGEVIWETATSISEPVLDVNGNYIVIADSNGKGICLYYRNKLAYSVQAENPILTVNVSSDGDTVVTTNKEFFKGAVEVFNKTGRRIFSWNSGSEYVMDASISPSTRRLAVSLLNTDENAKTNIRFFNIKDGKEYYTGTLENSVTLSSRFINGYLDITADNCIAGLKTGGETKWYEKFDENKLSGFAVDTRGNKIISAESDTAALILVYAEGGKLLTQFEVDTLPDSVDIQGRNILYNSGRSIYFGVPGKEKNFTASMDIKNLKIIDSSSCLVVYNNSLEFIN